MLMLSLCFFSLLVNRETSDKAFKSIVTIQSLSNFLYQIIKEAVPVDGSDLAKSKIPPAVALAAGESQLCPQVYFGR